MPFYRFHTDTPLPAYVAAERIRALTRDPPRFLESLRTALGSRDSDSRPFLGRVQGHAFRLRRDIRYRNSFLPLVWGDVQPGLSSTRVRVTMFLHPLVAAFMLFWLTGVGLAAWTEAGKGQSPWSLVPAGMFVFGVALTLGLHTRGHQGAAHPRRHPAISVAVPPPWPGLATPMHSVVC
jgi:hypothetical protein